jgi:peptidoglycan/xylan/chitin deacetylase (PgdA/CDA1 family)
VSRVGALARRTVRTPPVDAGLQLLAAGLERLVDDPPGRLLVLTYHRVDEPGARPGLYPGLLSATPRAFEQQLAWLGRRRRPVSIDDALAAQRGERPLPPGAVLVTIDDAYEDVAEHAWPTLQRLGIPAALFVPTAFPDAGVAFWWDRLWAAIWQAPEGSSLPLNGASAPVGDIRSRAATYRRVRAVVKALPDEVAMRTVDAICEQVEAPPPSSAVLGWAELRRLAAEGLALLPHSRTHPLLSRVPASRLDDEIEGSRRDLEARVGPVRPVFAYPSGAHDPSSVAAVEAAGYRLALTTERGMYRVGNGDRLRVPRVNVGPATTLAVLRLEALGESVLR